MTAKVALVTNVLDFVGPPAVTALLNDGFEVVAQAPAFADRAVREQYQKAHPGTVAVGQDDPAALIAEMWGRYQSVDVIISNDAFPAVHSSIEQANLGDLHATLHQLVERPFALVQAAIPHLKAQGTGKVIMITSCRTELPLAEGAIPDIARAGANALVKSLSLALAPFGIPVNAIAPNYLYSEAYFPKADFIDDPKGREFIRQVVPAGRLGDPNEIGELISYLANMKGTFHTGTVIKFAGGWPAAPARPL